MRSCCGSWWASLRKFAGLMTTRWNLGHVDLVFVGGIRVLGFGVVEGGGDEGFDLCGLVVLMDVVLAY